MASVQFGPGSRVITSPGPLIQKGQYLCIAIMPYQLVAGDIEALVKLPKDAPVVVLAWHLLLKPAAQSLGTLRDFSRQLLKMVCNS